MSEELKPCRYGWHDTGKDGFCKKCGINPPIGHTRTPDAGPQDVREAFEKRNARYDLSRNPHGRYIQRDIQNAWEEFNAGYQAASAETQRLKRQVDVLRSAVNLVRKQDSLRGSALMAAMDEALAAADKIAKE